MKDRLQLLLLLLLACLHSAYTTTSGGPASVPTPHLPAKPNLPLTLSCSAYGAPLTHCLWERRGSGRLLSFDTTARDGTPSSGSSDGYTYSGAGLSSGVCGLEIRSVREEDDGLWDCTLIGGRGIFRGTTRVQLLKKPTPPQFTPAAAQLTQLVDEGSGSPASATCGSADGQPPPIFRWFLGPHQLTPSDGLQPVLVSNSTAGHTVASQSLRDYPFSWRDHGLELRCLAEHEGYAEGDETEAKLTVQVRFAPRSSPLAPALSPESATVGDSFQLSLNISANPEPRIQWQVEEGGAALPPGGSNGRMRVGPTRELAPGLYSTTLSIQPVQDPDFRATFRVHAENQVGSAEFTLRLAGQSTSTAEGGLGAGAVVALILGIPLALILLAVGLVTSRAKGLLCFAAGKAASREDSIETEKRPNEQVKSSRGKLTARLSAFVDNLFAAAGKRKSDPEKQHFEAEPRPTASAAEESVVYAELALQAPKGTALLVKTDGTEYAEIVGVLEESATAERDGVDV